MKIFLGLHLGVALLCLNGCLGSHKHASASQTAAVTPQVTAEPPSAPRPVAAPEVAAGPEPTPIGEPGAEATSSVEAPAPAAPQPPTPARTPPVRAQPIAARPAKAQTETLTGKVILGQDGYRVRLADDESKSVYRLTRAKRSSEFVAEQINLRKYYEKTIVIRGKREADWIWSAEIVGQWNKPGESRGANLLAPPAPNR